MGPLFIPWLIHELMFNIWGVTTERGKRCVRRETLGDALKSRSPLWAALGLNLGVRGEKPATSCLSVAAAAAAAAAATTTTTTTAAAAAAAAATTTTTTTTTTNNNMNN